MLTFYFVCIYTFGIELQGDVFVHTFITIYQVIVILMNDIYNRADLDSTTYILYIKQHRLIIL